MADKFKTHRCEGSLACGVSIRKQSPLFQLWEIDEPDPDNVWWLTKMIPNLDGDSYKMEFMLRIKFCPFCGERLNES